MAVKKNIFLILFAVYFYGISAQSFDWAKANYTATEGHTIGADKFGNVYITGEYSYFSNSSNSYYYPMYLKLDSLGNVLIKKQPAIYPGKAIVDENGNMYYLNVAEIVKLDNTGQQVWTKLISGFNLLNLTFNPMGGIIIVGRYEDSTALTKTIFLRLDENGNEIWRRTGDFVGGGNIIACDKSGTTYFYTVTKQADASWTGSISKIDISGILSGTLSAPGTYAVDIKVDEDKSIILSGICDNVVINGQTYNSTTLSTNLYLVKYDSTGNFKWVQIIKGANIVLPCLATDAQNNIYLNGQYSDMTIDSVRYFIGLHQSSPFVLNTDGNGNIKSVMHADSVSGYASGYPKAMCLTKNNKVLTTGSVTGKLRFGNDITTAGNTPVMLVAQLSYPKTTVGLQKKNLPDSKLTVFPNPTNGIITIQSSFNLSIGIGGELRIENVLGQLIFAKKIATNGTGINETIDLSRHPKGIYFVQINSGSGVETRKIVLE